MTSRERVLTALRRREPDRVPKTMGLCASQAERLKAKREEGAPEVHYFDEMDVAGVQPGVPCPIPDVSAYLPKDLPEGTRIDDWGVAWTQSGFYHFLGMIHPMAGITTAAEIERYPFPDMANPERFLDFEDRVAQAKATGRAVLSGCSPLGGTIFWPAYKLRGMEALLMDMAAEPALAEALLDRVTDICTAYAAKVAEYDIDVLWLADDYGTQRGMVVSVDMWRTWFKPRLKRLIEAAKAKKPDLIVAHHCDGDATDIVGEFIDCGVDVLNPVQPECMDPAAVKREFGNHLAFWGTIGTQTTMPFGSPADVRAEVRRMIENVGKGGGLLLAPTHTVEPEVPWDNIVAFFEACEEYGVYA